MELYDGRRIVLGGVARRDVHREVRRGARADGQLALGGAGVPFYLRTGKRLVEGRRTASIAFRDPPAADVRLSLYTIRKSAPRAVLRRPS